MRTPAPPHTPSLMPHTSGEVGPGRGIGTFASLRHRDFRLLWFGTLFMSAGNWVQTVTLGWLVYDLTGSSVLLGVLNGLRALPFLIAGPMAGVLADRADRKSLMLISQVVLLVTALILGVVVALEWVEVWHLMLFAVVTGMAWALNQPTRQAIVPNLVPRRDLLNAVALNSTAFNINKVMGPLIGGVLIAAFGAAGNFFVQALAYAGVMVMVLIMTVPKGPVRGHASAWSDLKEGLRYVKGSPIIFAILIASLIPNVFAFPYQALMPIFQKDVFNEGPWALGVLMAAPGIGGMASLLFLASFSHRVARRGRMMLIGLLVLGTSLILFAGMRSLPLAAFFLIFVGGGQVIYNNVTNNLLQELVPDHLRGRVMSLYMLDHGLAPAGSLMAGIATHFFGAPWTVAAMGAVVVVLAVLVIVKVPELYHWRPEAEGAG